MSNGESKIARFKAARCCGFAIALRALFRVILCFFVGDSLLVDCFALLAMTQKNLMFNMKWRLDLVALNHKSFTRFQAFSH